MLEPHERLDRSELARFRRRDMTPQGLQSGDLLGYEHGDANLRAVVSSMTIILGSVLIIMALAYVAFRYFDGREMLIKNRMTRQFPMMATDRQPAPPSPRLLPSPVVGANDMPWDAMIKERAASEDRVNLNPQWLAVKENKDSAHGAISIAQAMHEIASENHDPNGQGLPARAAISGQGPLYPPSVNYERDDERMDVESSGGRTLEAPAAQAPQSFPRADVRYNTDHNPVAAPPTGENAE